MGKTSIQWTDFSVNPLRARNKETGKIGHFCDKISPGCKNCYASKMQAGPYLSGLVYIAENKPKVEFFLDEKVLHQVIRRKKPTKYFWADMTDIFLDDYQDEWIDACFAAMALSPQHTHQVLTKRPERMLSWFGTGFKRYDAVRTQADLISCRIKPEWDWPLSNVWLGVSVENREYAERRIPLLREAPAIVRFLSIEPLLEDIGKLDLRGIGWVIVGGESGPDARPCNTEWIHSIVNQCKSAGVATFVKQVGSNVIQGGEHRRKRDRKGGDPHEWPHEIRVRQMPSTYP